MHEDPTFTVADGDEHRSMAQAVAPHLGPRHHTKNPVLSVDHIHQFITHFATLPCRSRVTP